MKSNPELRGTKQNKIYLKIQVVPRSKPCPSLLQKPVS